MSNTSNMNERWNPEVNQDEAIMEQEKLIEKEIAEKIELIGPLISVSCLSEEYLYTDSIYQDKIKDLTNNYRGFRRTRPDGNCFFRAFSYLYFETLLNDKLELKRFIQVSERNKQKLIELGFPSFTIEDFYECFSNVLKKIEKGEVTTIDDLLSIFNDQSISDYLVVYMRLMTSGYLQSNAEFFANFMENEISVKDFCAHEVEPMYKESDHIHIIAITESTGVSVLINYLDRGSNDKVTKHIFPESSKPRIHLLYRPGHYDILYPK